MNKKERKQSQVSDAIKGKPVFYNDFDGTFGVMEHIGGEPYILEPDRYPQPWSLHAQKDDLNWKFMGYAGEEIDAVMVLNVLGLMFENCADDYVKSLCLMTERLEKFFVIHDEIFDLKLEIEHTGKNEVSITVKHNIYLKYEVFANIDNIELEPDFGLDDWVRIITTPVTQLYPSANVIVDDIKNK